MGVPGRGGRTFLTESRIGWGPLFPKIIGLGFDPGFWDGGGGGWDLQKIQSVWGFWKTNPTCMGLACPNPEEMGPPDVAKVELQGKPTGFLSDRFFSVHTGGGTVGLYNSRSTHLGGPAMVDGIN